MELKIAIGQLNPVVGDIVGNTRKIRELYLDAAERGVDLVVTPELSITGCPLGGLAFHPELPAACRAAFEVLRAATAGRGAALIAGAVTGGGRGLRSSAVVFCDGAVLREVHRGIVSGDGNVGDAFPFSLRGVRIGIAAGGDMMALRDNGAQILLDLASTSFRPDGLRERAEAAARWAVEAGLPLLSVNQVGGQDETVFAGGSFLMDSGGRRALQLPLWEECVMDCDAFAAGPIADESWPDPLESVYLAMMTGLHDYAEKSGFSDVVLGLSGGMDAALVAAVAGDALGAERVHCVRLPSRYTSDLSNDAAEEMARVWNFDLRTLPIEKMTAAADETLGPLFPEGLKKLTRENMQARARGYLLMTLSNDNGWLLLSTGNKSELAVGYSTLYGDMCGGFNPLKDVFKTTVFELARWRNANRPSGIPGPSGVVIPPAIIERAPSAELSPDQKDTDSLPPYPELDAILGCLLEDGLPRAEIVARGFAPAVVERVCRMVRRAEYKRRQGAPGPMMTAPLSASGGVMPLVNRFDSSIPELLREMGDEEGR